MNPKAFGDADDYRAVSGERQAPEPQVFPTVVHSIFNMSSLCSLRSPPLWSKLFVSSVHFSMPHSSPRMRPTPMAVFTTLSAIGNFSLFLLNGWDFALHGMFFVPPKWKNASLFQKQSWTINVSALLTHFRPSVILLRKWRLGGKQYVILNFIEALLLNNSRIWGHFQENLLPLLSGFFTGYLSGNLHLWGGAVTEGWENSVSWLQWQY